MSWGQVSSIHDAETKEKVIAADAPLDSEIHANNDEMKRLDE